MMNYHEISEYPLIFIEPFQGGSLDCVQQSHSLPLRRTGRPDFFSSRPDPDDGGRSEGTTLALP